MVEIKKKQPTVSEQMQDELEPIVHQHPTEHDESDDLEDAKRAEEPEEEYDEVTIPSESDLKAMTKKAINAQAVILDFDVPTSLTKTKMIESFLQQTEEFIAGLQDSGEFVSATMDDGEDDDDTNNNQDGGYF